MKTLKQIFEEAATAIETKGWRQGWFFNEDGCMCLLGGVSFAVSGKPSPGLIEAGPLDALYCHATRKLCDVMGVAPHVWNDEPGRTKEQVVAKLREVAAACD